MECARSGNQEDFSQVVTIDKAKCAARGLQSLGLTYLLCTFHAYVAMLKWFTEQGIRESSLLVSLLYCAWFMARGRTVADVKRRADRVKAAVLPRLGLGHVLVEKIKKKYWDDEWLDEDGLWLRAWTDIWRAERGFCTR